LPIIRSLSTTAAAASGLPYERGGSSAVGRGRSGRTDHDQQHSCSHAVSVIKTGAYRNVDFENTALGYSPPLLFNHSDNSSPYKELNVGHPLMFIVKLVC